MFSRICRSSAFGPSTAPEGWSESTISRFIETEQSALTTLARMRSTTQTLQSQCGQAFNFRFVRTQPSLHAAETRQQRQQHLVLKDPQFLPILQLSQSTGTTYKIAPSGLVCRKHVHTVQAVAAAMWKVGSMRGKAPADLQCSKLVLNFHALPSALQLKVCMAA